MVEIIYKMSKPYKKDDQLGKVRKRAKIRNWYNKVPHLTQDTTWASDKHTIRHHKWEPISQPIPSRWQQGINKQTRESITNTRQKKHKRSTALEQPVNIFYRRAWTSFTAPTSMKTWSKPSFDFNVKMFDGCLKWDQKSTNNDLWSGGPKTDWDSALLGNK